MFSRYLIGFFLFCVALLAVPSLCSATEEYAKQTGKECAACHLDPGGGGELTAAGKAFTESRKVSAEQPKSNYLSKGLHLVIGYIHFLTAIFWFGTILYVHLILKPAYAANGLPRGELRVGVISMIVMGVTGAVLTLYRVSSLDMLLHTRFGILLSIKVSLYLVMVSSAIIVITVIGPRLKAKKKESPLVDAISDTITDEELASRDGKDGRSAWFAFEGKIYDATHSSRWQHGVHMGRHQAGTDLTEALKLAPHGQDKITVMPVVGKLTTVTFPRQTPLHERVFFFMAYTNLVIVFIIVLILALWRWG